MMMFAMVMVIILMMRSKHTTPPSWAPPCFQVRLTHQFEEGVTIGVHLVSAPKKAKLNPGGFRWPSSSSSSWSWSWSTTHAGSIYKMHDSLSPPEFHQHWFTAGRWSTSGDHCHLDGFYHNGHHVHFHVHVHVHVHVVYDVYDDHDADIYDAHGRWGRQYSMMFSADLLSVSSFAKCAPHFTELLADKSYLQSLLFQSCFQFQTSQR